MMLILDGRTSEAEAVFHDAVQAGETEALLGVALLLAREPGRRADAERVLRLAAYAEVSEGALLLGALLTGQPGREADAEAFYRTALDSGLGTAEWGLAVLRGETELG